MAKAKKAITIEEANRDRQSIDYAMKLALNKAREFDDNMIDILYNDAKSTFESYFEKLFVMVGE